MKTKNIRHLITKILVDIMFFGGIAACIAVPFALPRLMAFVGSPPEFRTVYTFIFIGSGLCAVYIMYQLKCMFKTLLGGNPFVIQNVSGFRKCAVASAVIAAIFLIRLILWFTIAASFIVLVFAILSLFCLTIKDLFKQAVAYKEDADWTV